MNTLKKFSVETHKGWASFQTWIKKWNKIMAVIFSALGIILLLSTVIVNALEVHEENQEQQKNGQENSRSFFFELCRRMESQACLLYCSSGTSTNIVKELNLHWEMNSVCQLEGMSINISSAVHFPEFTLHSDWLNGNFTLKELQIDLENIFVILEGAFTSDVFKSLQKLVFHNLHSNIMDTQSLQNLFVEQHYKHFTMTKKSFSEKSIDATMELYYDSIFYAETDETFQIINQQKLGDTISFADITQPLIIGLTIIGCILSFSLGLFIRYNLIEQKLFLNKMNKANHMIYMVEKDAPSSSFNVRNEKNGENLVPVEVNAENDVYK